MNSDTLKKSSSTYAKAVLLMLLSAFFFSAMQLAIKKSGQGGEVPLFEQVFFRNIVSLVAAFLALRKKGIPMFGSRAARPYLFGRSLSGFLAVIAFFYATNHAKIADASIINKLSPIIVAILAGIFLKEKVKKSTYIAMAISFIGTAIVCGPTLDSSFFAMMVALFSAVLSGVAYTFVSVLKDKADPLVVIMHFSTFSVVSAGILMLPGFSMPSLSQLLMLCLVGVCGSLGQITLTYSYRFAPASEISIFNYSGIVWSALLGVMFLGEPLGLSTVAGGLLIILASLIMFIYGRKDT